jgi:hypothetical protein
MEQDPGGNGHVERRRTWPLALSARRVSPCVARWLARNLVTNDHARSDADDPLPGDDGVAMHPRLSRPATPVSADSIALEDAELAGNEAAHPKASSHDLSTDVVNVAKPLAGLSDYLSVQKV